MTASAPSAAPIESDWKKMKLSPSVWAALVAVLHASMPKLLATSRPDTCSHTLHDASSIALASLLLTIHVHV
jgi:hypothetical protein